MSIANLMNSVMIEDQYLPAAEVSVSIERLTDRSRNETLGFLAERAVHTVILAGFIRDNGMESRLNRGTMYGCRNSEGRLEGVALIGHTTLVEARTEAAIRQLARTAKTQKETQPDSGLHMIMGEQERVEKFWRYFADDDVKMRRSVRELLLELRKPCTSGALHSGPRLATLADLELIAPVHAEMAWAESGVNPLDMDPVGFLQRCARRIERRRVWVLRDGMELVFKADIQADTPDVIYLEGVYVSPKYRGNGIGRQCISQLTQELLKRTDSVCVLVNEDNVKALELYRSSNFEMSSYYSTIFLEAELRQFAAATIGLVQSSFHPPLT